MGPGLTIAGAGLLTVLGSIARKQAPHPRIFLGTAVAGAGVLILAQHSPDAAAKFAAVVFLTALLTSGYDVAQGVTRALT
jgi:hypothetical protein